jgi:CRP-like cAMP-binding protein
MTKNTDLLHTIRALPGFENLPEAQAEFLADISSFLSLGEHELAFREDEASSDLFYIVSGLMESRMRVPGRQRDEDEGFSTLKSGEYFGETAFLDGSRREASLAARERCLLLKLDGSALRERCKADPELAARVYALLGRTSAQRYRDVSLELRNAATYQ